MTSQGRDGGYGWVIILAFFLTSVIVDGIRFSFGILFVELLNEFNSGKGETAWIGSIMIGTYNLCGPVFALIVIQLGCRKACFLGSTITCIGFICSYFTTQLWHLYITYGLFLGFGYGILYLAGTVSIGKYFLKRRAIALGLGCCGSGVGQFGFTPLFNTFVQTYTWRGAMFICAGLSLQCCVFGALYRPFEDITSNEIDIAIDTYNVDEEDYEKEQGVPMLQNGDVTKDCNDRDIKVNGNKNNIYSNGKPNKHDDLNHKTSPVRTFAQMREEQLKSYKNKNSSNLGSSRSLNLSVLSQSVLGSNASFEVIMSRRKRNKSYKPKQNPDIPKDTNDTNSAQESKLKSVIESLFPRKLVTNMNFVLMLFSSFFFGVASFIPYSILPDYAIHYGIPQGDSVWLISMIGVGGTISRLVLGFITDLPCVHRLSLFGALLFICGVSTLLIPFLTTFSLLLAYSFTFGFAFGGMYVVQPCLMLDYFGEENIAEILGVLMFVLGISVLIGAPTAGAVYVVQPCILIDYFGEENIAEILGVLMFVLGISQFVGSPSAGWIYDITKNYNISVIFAGALFILSGLTNFLVLCSKPSRAERKRRKEVRKVESGAA